MVEGRYLAEDMVALDDATLPTLYSDGALRVNATDDGIVLNETATVIEADATAANGVLHIIDSVLLPERPQ